MKKTSRPLFWKIERNSWISTVKQSSRVFGDSHLEIGTYYGSSFFNVWLDGFPNTSWILVIWSRSLLPANNGFNLMPFNYVGWVFYHRSTHVIISNITQPHWIEKRQILNRVFANILTNRPDIHSLSIVSLSYNTFWCSIPYWDESCVTRNLRKTLVTPYQRVAT